MKDFKSLLQYGNRSKKFVNRYKTNNRVVILKDKQTFTLNTTTLTFVPNLKPTAPYHYVDSWGYIFRPTNRRPYSKGYSIYLGYSPYTADIKQRRNDKCSCGSGKKYKKCHMTKIDV